MDSLAVSLKAAVLATPTRSANALSAASVAPVHEIVTPSFSIIKDSKTNGKKRLALSKSNGKSARKGRTVGRDRNDSAQEDGDEAANGSAEVREAPGAQGRLD